MSDLRIVQYWKDTTVSEVESIANGKFTLSRRTIALGINISMLKLNDSIFVSVSTDYWGRLLEFLHGRMPNLIDIEQFAQELGLDWNPPDDLYYLETSNGQSRRFNGEQLEVRQISPDDLAAFEEMTNACSEEDLDAGYVDIDHSIVFGVFVGAQMVCRASAYPFMQSTEIYDIGYITHPQFKGKGYASICCNSLVNEIVKRGKVPQIRVQTHIYGSIRVAEKVGFVKQGEWTYDKQD